MRRSTPPARRHAGGYTLPELMTMIVVIGLVITVAAQQYHAFQVHSREGDRKVRLGEIASALSSYYADLQAYPMSNFPSPYSSEPRDVFSNGPGRNGDWIPGLAPKYLPKLPRDPEGGYGPNSACNAAQPPYKRAFAYVSDGKSWKVMSRCSRPAKKYDPADPYFDPVRPYWATMLCSSDRAACQAW